MAWEPLLEGEAATEALRVAHEVAEEIASLGSAEGRSISEGRCGGVSIAREPGAPAAERVVFWAYACSAFDEPFANAAYEAAVDELIGDLARAPHVGLFDGGLTGIAWTLAHVLGSDLDAALVKVDDALVRQLRAGWSGTYDLTRGLVGFGVYFLERLATGAATASARDGLELVVAELDRTAARSDRGACWHTPHAWLLRRDRDRWPDGHVDCGLAHGTAGAIAFLARASAIADAPAAAAPLCRAAARWLAGTRYAPGSGGSVYPSMVRPHDRLAEVAGIDTSDGAGGTADGGAHKVDDARTAWCYGDAGVASALWLAAAHTRDAELLAAAHDAARAAAPRSERACGVDDPMLCHGAAGLAHLFHRYYRASRDPALGDAAVRWFARTLDMRRPDSVGHFGAERGFAYPAADLLSGWLGASLALLGAATASEPAWDRMFLCDVPAI